ncbi:MAG: hypothetical protein EZS28_008119 [Streblomastix strix]|uniref:SPRY domain-containing protein n=1 Tax=Streblomastix strix TaxID=222440 RepID=A0A5J4WNZ8_9EUKA|nr:MAG: hypothetical protein EZS28_008119 [Streblomastix strix]
MQSDEQKRIAELEQQVRALQAQLISSQEQNLPQTNKNTIDAASDIKESDEKVDERQIESKDGLINKQNDVDTQQLIEEKNIEKLTNSQSGENWGFGSKQDNDIKDSQILPKIFAPVDISSDPSNEDLPITFFNATEIDESIGQIERIEGGKLQLVKTQDDYLSVTLDAIFNQGIIKCNVKFGKFVYGSRGVGIVKASHKIQHKNNQNSLEDEINNRNLVFYDLNEGYVSHKGEKTRGNDVFGRNKNISVELNMNEGTFHLFKEGEQQPIFIRGINEPVRLFIYLHWGESSFVVESLQKIKLAQSVKGIKNEIAIDW